MVISNSIYTKGFQIVIYKAFWLDVAQDRQSRASNETQTISRRFLSLASKLLHHPKRQWAVPNTHDNLKY